MNIELLRTQHLDISGRVERMRAATFEQISNIIESEDVALGVPMESRIKDWASIEEKVQRKGLEVTDIKFIPDLIGIRVIILFRSDLERVDGLIRKTFQVLSSEDKSEMLDETQFGYQSLHYNIKFPSSWLSIPSMSDLGELQVEVQVRTLAQHIWAAASHKLQYKNEASIPPPIRRSINRVSALLETVDLEFERVLLERKSYKENEIPEISSDEELNVDIIEAVLDKKLPANNKKDSEPYEKLLRNLKDLEINKVGELKDLIDKHIDSAIASDKKRVESQLKTKTYNGTSEERLKSGVFFTHIGLLREVLRAEFGSERVAEIMKN